MLELINREDFINKDRKEVMEEFQKMLNEYVESIKDFDVEQCKEEEKRLISVMDELDKVITNVEYELPKSCCFMGSPAEITRKTIGKYICELLEKVDCEYQYTLGYYQLYMWWKDPKSKINYTSLNSTLQVLGANMCFRGPHQWEMILSINEYFKPVHNAYIIDNMMLHLYGTAHSKLLDQMKVQNPLEPEADGEGEQKAPAEE